MRRVKLCHYRCYLWGLNMQQVHCDGCGEDVPSYDITHYGSIERGYRDLCSRCFSAEVAKLSGLDNFDYARLEPIGITDCDGESHQFHFVTRLLGHMVTLEAFELREGKPYPNKVGVH